jgi:peptidoglycan lytic transglycosylase
MHKRIRLMSRLKYTGIIAIAWGLAVGAGVLSMQVTAAPDDGNDTSAATTQNQSQAQGPSKAPLDRSGHKRIGTASFYASRYSNRVMSDGHRMRPESNNAASLTLPLGTTAKVTNLATGKSAFVTIQDRGPYVRGRIIDLSPATAQRIGLERKQGLTKVEVVPLTVPLADGTVKIVSNMRIDQNSLM